MSYNPWQIKGQIESNFKVLPLHLQETLKEDWSIIQKYLEMQYKLVTYGPPSSKTESDEKFESETKTLLANSIQSLLNKCPKESFEFMSQQLASIYEMINKQEKEGSIPSNICAESVNLIKKKCIEEEQHLHKHVEAIKIKVEELQDIDLTKKQEYEKKQNAQIQKLQNKLEEKENEIKNLSSQEEKPFSSNLQNLNTSNKTTYPPSTNKTTMSMKEKLELQREKNDSLKNKPQPSKTQNLGKVNSIQDQKQTSSITTTTTATTTTTTTSTATTTTTITKKQSQCLVFYLKDEEIKKRKHEKNTQTFKLIQDSIFLGFSKQVLANSMLEQVVQQIKQIKYNKDNFIFAEIYISKLVYKQNLEYDLAPAMFHYKNDLKNYPNLRIIFIIKEDVETSKIISFITNQFKQLQVSSEMLEEESLEEYKQQQLNQIERKNEVENQARQQLIQQLQENHDTQVQKLKFSLQQSLQNVKMFEQMKLDLSKQSEKDKQLFQQKQQKIQEYYDISSILESTMKEEYKSEEDQDQNAPKQVVIREESNLKLLIQINSDLFKGLDQINLNMQSLDPEGSKKKESKMKSLISQEKFTYRILLTLSNATNSIPIFYKIYYSLLQNKQQIQYNLKDSSIVEIVMQHISGERALSPEFLQFLISMNMKQMIDSRQSATILGVERRFTQLFTQLRDYIQNTKIIPYFQDILSTNTKSADVLLNEYYG